MLDDALFTSDFKEQPYWWGRAAPGPRTEPPPLPSSADVVIIGSGVTGMSAALHLARAGAAAAVLDMDAIGHGASRRNAGFLGRVLKRDVVWLEQRHGTDYAMATYRELNEAFQTVKRIVSDEQLDACLNICGRYYAANSPAHYELLAKELEENRKRLGLDYYMVPRSEQHKELASDLYYGGAVIPDLGSIHPGLYHKGMTEAAIQAGAQLFPHTKALKITRLARTGDRRFRVETSRGTIEAANVIEATNGYTQKEQDWLVRRVIPFTGYMIATEILPPERIDALLPKRRTYLETCMNINFIRPAPDTQRILFGGMTGSPTPSIRHRAAELRDLLRKILPGIGDVRISHAWSGYCAGTFDFMPHIGGEDGHYHAAGYNFAGVPLGSYFGVKLSEMVLGKPGARSVFEEHHFPTLPLYRGNPWFVPLAMKYFDWHDARIARSKPA